MRYGLLLVVGIDSKPSDRVRWICKCDCGNTKSILGVHLVRNLISTCGCKSAELRREKVFHDLSGQVFGRWTVLEHRFGKTGTKWLCECACGNQKWVFAGHLISLASTSCGCRNREIASARNSTHGASRGKRLKEFTIWCGMRKRCKHHPAYAGRGITICDGWKSFVNFFSDMGEIPLGNFSIERLDNNGGYWCGHCSECTTHHHVPNCVWATSTEQANNKRNTVMVTCDGITQPASMWDRECGYKIGTVAQRIRDGWEAGRAIKQTPRERADLKTH